MASILLIIGKLYRDKFKYNYLRKKYLLWIFAPFLISTSTFEHFDKKYEPDSLYISRITEYKSHG